LKQEQVLGGFDSANYTVERLMAPARDGIEVPISLVYPTGIERDGSNPTLLYAYGSYGSSMEAWFRPDVVSLLDRGFVFAIAHIRGGQEMGRWWYEDGKLLKKKNTFTDFIDCGQYLVDQGYTSPGRLFARGGSAGGLLMGAVSNMAPELFAGIIANMPWVDVVTTMLDDDIPLTTGEFDEWGDPKQREYYDYMLSYSPYDNVEAKDYPAMLVTTALEDSQVQYFEPAKWVAKLRAMKTDDNPLLFNCEMSAAGHGGVSGRFKKNRETALEYAFMLGVLNGWQ
jgi:oligopeptidase B